MFYAIEYAYGRNVQNNGAKADRTMEFTASGLRDAWVSDGALFGGEGSRDALSARSARFKGCTLEEGDKEAWQIVAAARVAANPKLKVYQEIILQDWNDSGHPEWVATVTEEEVVSWAKAVSDA